MKRSKKSEPELQALGSVKDVRVEGKILMVACENGAIRVSAVSPEVVRIRAARDGNFEPDNSYAVVESDWPEAHWDADWSGDDVIFSTNALRLHLDKSSLRLMVTDSGDEEYFHGLGNAAGFRDAKPEWSFTASPGEMFLGLGEKTGGLDKRGKKWVNWSTDRPYLTWSDPLYQTVPFVMGLKGTRAYGIFFDNTFKSSFDLCASAPDKWTWQAHGGEINAYVIAGPALKDVTRRFYKLVGGIPMPPRWGLGYHQSKYSYKTDKEVRQIANRFRDLDIPLDAIHLDIHYMRGYRIFTFDQKRFPDPRKLSDDLKKEGIRLITIVDPGVKEDEDWEVWRDGVKKRVFCEYDKGGVVIKYCWPLRAGWPDFGSEDARRWWGEQHRFYLDNGISGFWNDMNEPSMWNGGFYFLDAVVPTGIYYGEGMRHTHFGKPETHERCRNVYGMMEDRASREGLLELRSDERPLVITRSGYAGVGRYAIMWTGDNFSTWRHLRASVPMILNLGLTAQPIAGSDIGGFVMSTTPELYARWIQLGALYPFCRTHTSIYTKKQEPYSFGKRVENIARQFIGLRYRLMPFIYSLVWNSHLNGDPVWRPMSYEFPDDAVAARLDDQFMLGSHLLVAPVMKKGQTERTLYLPKGRWTDFFTGETRKGDCWITVPAPFEHMPIYVREGGIIPMGPLMKHTDELPTDPLSLNIYPGTGSFDLFEDDGISMKYVKGVYARTPYRVQESSDKLLIELGARVGPFSVAPRKMIVRNFTKERPTSIKVNGNPLPADSLKLDDAFIEFPLQDDGKEMTIEFGR